MKRINMVAALACVLLLALSLVGCGAFSGTTNNLQSIQLSTSNAQEAPPGTPILEGIGGTVQLYTWGNYSNGVPKLLDDVAVAYQIVITPGNGAAVDPGTDSLYPLDSPPSTVEISVNGLLTAVTPSACTFYNTATTGTSPAWAMVGSYSVTATYKGLTSPPVFVAVASAPGFTSTTNPTGACGPSPTGG